MRNWIRIILLSEGWAVLGGFKEKIVCQYWLVYIY